jgi:hypothetical protein
VRLLAGLFVGAVVFGPLCAYIFRQKDRSPVTGYVLGLFFGCIGLAIVAVWPSSPEDRNQRDAAERLRQHDLRMGRMPSGLVGAPAYGEPPPGTPPGWYPDPKGSSAVRQWDGGGWTPNLHDPATGQARFDPM